MLLLTYYYLFAALLMGAWLAWMLAKPAAWESWIDRENRFWRGQSWVRASWIDLCERIEKGPWIRWVVGTACAVFLILAVESFSRMNIEPIIPWEPYQPAVQVPEAIPDPKPNPDVHPSMI